VGEIGSVAYRCKECREDFGDPEKEPQFETWHMLVLLHVYNEHEQSPDPINAVLVARYLDRVT